MFIYMSGTPRNDKFQNIENKLCTHRLFSLHGAYERAVQNWLNFTKKEAENGNMDFPKFIMLDSGAFTAWNAGEETRLEDVFRSYDKFEKNAGILFDQIWMINLDKIPGERGRDPTADEVKEAIEISDINYAKLVDRFGERILPVFHQGEPDERMFELAEIAKYLCISPRNDVHEGLRKIWSQERHFLLHERYPGHMTHGLATTGNNMIADVPWFSVDSAAWIIHAAYGKLDVFEGKRYANYFVTYEGGKQKREPTHIDNMLPYRREQVIAAIENYGFTLEQVQTDVRPRSLVCMGELAKFVAFARENKKTREICTQQTLFGET
jgi:hypothetical protein